MQLKKPIDIPSYGGWSYRGDCPTEVQEQITLVARIRAKYPDTYGKLVVHIRNEGQRTMAQIRRQKAEGLTKGASDIFIPGSPAFLCELKRKDPVKSKISDEQVKYLLAAKAAGAFVCVALGCDAAEAAFDDWRELNAERIRIETGNL